MAQPVSGYLYTRNVLLADARRTVSGSANTTGLDVASSKGNGVTFVCTVDTVTAAGNVTATVQHSDDNSTFTSVSGATLVLTATGVALLFVPNISKRYVRIAWSLNSGTSIVVTTLLYLQPGEATTSSGYTIAPQV